MYRMHNITRMFMCRCCNWAFPDKTSLHIHMQSMLKNGTPGEAAVLAKSSDGTYTFKKIWQNWTISVVDGSSESNSPSHSPNFSPDMIIQKRMMQAAANNNNISSIFPNLLKNHESKPVFPLDLSNMGASQFLTAWLANSPINAAALNLAAQQTPSKVCFLAHSIEIWTLKYFRILSIQISAIMMTLKFRLLKKTLNLKWKALMSVLDRWSSRLNVKLVKESTKQILMWKAMT